MRVALIALLVVGVAAAQDGGFGRRKKKGKEPESPRTSIRAKDLSTLLHSLCDKNRFEGRKSAKPGEQKTAEFIASKFRKYGLKPAGENGTFLQSFKANTRFARGTGTNVMGFLEGSDPKLKKEIIAVGAHIDAYGGVGADDDGSGTVSMMELAEAFGKLKERPKRTLLFYGWGSEEAWMVGSYHYSKTPAKFRIDEVKVYLNLDMVGRNDASEKQVTISGSESGDPSMRPLVEKHGKNAGLKVQIEKPLKSPPGDVMPFYENGVPFLYFYTYRYGAMHSDYHKPTDLPEKIDYTAQEKITRLAFDIMLELADQDRMPAHVKGYKFPHPATSR